MKKFIKAIKSPNDPDSPQLNVGSFYELIIVVKCNKFISGKAAVIIQENDIKSFDSSFFE